MAVCQRRLELSETEETKLEKYCFLEVRINLWYWLRRDLKEDLSRAEWVRFQRFSARRTVDLKAIKILKEKATKENSENANNKKHTQIRNSIC